MARDRLAGSRAGVPQPLAEVPGGAQGAGGRRSPDALAIAVMTQLVGQALGSSGTDLLGWYQGAKTKLREAVRRDPIDANLSFVLGATALFYAAEKGVNPKVKTLGDALVYTTTCLSVGYSDIFARTESGKLVGSILMTIGPALTGAFLDPPASAEPGSSTAAPTVPAAPAVPAVPAVPAAPPVTADAAADPNLVLQAAILNRLDEILATLKAGAR